jgi:hypothetical protein
MIYAFKLRFTESLYEDAENSGGIETEWNTQSFAVTKVELVFLCQQVFLAFLHSVPLTKWVSA